MISELALQDSWRTGCYEASGSWKNNPKRDADFQCGNQNKKPKVYVNNDPSVVVLHDDDHDDDDKDGDKTHSGKGNKESKPSAASKDQDQEDADEKKKWTWKLWWGNGSKPADEDEKSAERNKGTKGTKGTAKSATKNWDEEEKEKPTAEAEMMTEMKIMEVDGSVALPNARKLEHGIIVSGAPPDSYDGLRNWHKEGGGIFAIMNCQCKEKAEALLDASDYGMQQLVLLSNPNFIQCGKKHFKACVFLACKQCGAL